MPLSAAKRVLISDNNLNEFFYKPIERVDEEKVFNIRKVTEGHPDKICDQISDAILDEILTQDKRWVRERRHHRPGFAMGDHHERYVDIPAIVRKTIIDRHLRARFDGNTRVITRSRPEFDIAVVAAGSGDQGMMFGFACRRPRSHAPSHKPCAQAHHGPFPGEKERGDSYLRPDGRARSPEYLTESPRGGHHSALKPALA